MVFLRRKVSHLETQLLPEQPRDAMNRLIHKHSHNLYPSEYLDEFYWKIFAIIINFNNIVRGKINYFNMLITNLTAWTATSYSLSNVIATILSLNLDVNNSSLPFNSSVS